MPLGDPGAANRMLRPVSDDGGLFLWSNNTSEVYSIFVDGCAENGPPLLAFRSANPGLPLVALWSIHRAEIAKQCPASPAARSPIPMLAGRVPWMGYERRGTTAPVRS